MNEGLWYNEIEYIREGAIKSASMTRTQKTLLIRKDLKDKITKYTSLDKYNQNKHSDNFYKYATFHSAEEIVKFLEMAGFEVQEKKQTVFSLKNKPHEIKAGVGDGVFAVIKAKKQD